MVQFRELTVCLFSLQWGFISQRCTVLQVSWRPPGQGRTQPSRTTLWGFDQRYFCLGFEGEMRRSGQGWGQIRWEGKIPQREKYFVVLLKLYLSCQSLAEEAAKLDGIFLLLLWSESEAQGHLKMVSLVFYLRAMSSGPAQSFWPPCFFTFIFLLILT